jgi:hypothetical protein
VEGVTVEKASGKTRQISGTIILAERGRYTSTFDLDTVSPAPTAGAYQVIGGRRTVTSQRCRHGAHAAGVSTTPGVDRASPSCRGAWARASSRRRDALDDGAIDRDRATHGERSRADRTTLCGSYVAPAVGEAR